MHCNKNYNAYGNRAMNESKMQKYFCAKYTRFGIRQADQPNIQTRRKLILQQRESFGLYLSFCYNISFIFSARNTADIVTQG